MTEDTVNITKEIVDAEEQQIAVQHYTLTGEEPIFKMLPGDLIVICNVLNDYKNLLREASEVAELSPGTQMIYDVHADRCECIQRKIEKQMDYNVEEAIEKCRRKNVKKDDVGEDALVLALKRRAESKKDNTNKPVKIPKKRANGKEEMNQISIFDLMEE